MKIYLLVLISLVFSKLSFSQQVSKDITSSYSIQGTVIDTVDKAKLKNCTIVVISAQDSILQGFTRTNLAGRFILQDLNPGKLTMIVYSSDYAEFRQTFVIDSNNRNIDFGSVSLVLKTHLLQEVIISGNVSQIKIKGDTTEYNAGSFKIQPNAKVEDLLKQLPGIQIDKDGKITAQGVKINRVLVDGEEFFGDDPTLVTRNLRADMIDKVQIFDKTSDQAAFTGVNDGKKEKTINVKLKDDKKNGYFGKIDGGIGTDGYFRGQALFNKFKEKQKFSIYSIFGNDGVTGLGWQDNAKYASSTVDLSEAGMIIHLGGGDEFDNDNGRYNGQGIPSAKTGGVHYDNKWKDDKQSINVDYKIGSIIIKGNSSIISDNNLPENTLKSISDQNSYQNLFKQKLNGVYKLQLDSTSILKVGFSGFLKHTKSNDDYTSQTTDQLGGLLNNSRREVTNNGKQNNYSTDLLFTKRLRKAGRSYTIYLGQSFDENNSTGFLKSGINFYNDKGTVDSVQNIDQFKVNNLKNLTVNSNLTYSEPLSKSLSILLNYSFAYGSSNSSRESFNPLSAGRYTILDTLYSNDFKLKQFSNQAGAALNYNKNKTSLNIGTKVGNVNFQQLNNFSGTKLDKNYTIWIPQANAQYRLSQHSALRLNYNGNTVLPTISQLQPVRINLDPLNVTVGNPGLTPAFDHRLFFGYNSFTPSNGQLIGVFANYTITTNPIVNDLRTDTNGKSIIGSLNLGGKMPSNINFNIFYDRKIKPLDLSAGINLGVNGNTYYNLTNGEINITKSYTYTGQLRFSKTVPEKYDFNFSLGPTFTVSGSSLQPNLSNSGNGFLGNGSFVIYLPWKFQFYSDASYQYNSKTEVFDQTFSRLIVNSSVNKTFLKERNLKLSLSVNDLLNQNNGFNRVVNGNFISQNNFITIRRFFMFSLTYDFNKVGVSK